MIWSFRFHAVWTEATLTSDALDAASEHPYLGRYGALLPALELMRPGADGVLWQKVFVPHMQTNVLHAMTLSNKPWIDLPLVERELAARAD